MCEDTGEFGLFVLQSSVGVAVGAFLFILLLMAGTAIFADKSVDWCYSTVKAGPEKSQYVLMGHRNWTDNVEMGYFETFDATVAAANKISCPMNHKETK